MLMHMRAAMRVHAVVRACARTKTRPNDIPCSYTELCFPIRAIISLCRDLDTISLIIPVSLWSAP